MLRDEIAKALVLMNQPGVLKGGPQNLSPELIDIWAALLEDEGANPNDIGPACKMACRKLTFFPAPAEFLPYVAEARGERIRAENAARKALPEPEYVPITEAQREAIRSRLSIGAQEILDVIEGRAKLRGKRL